MAALGALLTTFDAPSWCFLGPKMPSEAMLRPKYGFTKSIGKRKENHTHIFDPKMASKSRMMTPKSFQEPSWPLLDRSGGILGRSWRILGRSWGLLGGSGADLGCLRTIFGRSWGLLGPILGVLGRSWGDLRASWGAQGSAQSPQLSQEPTGGSAVRARRRGLPSNLLRK